MIQKHKILVFFISLLAAVIFWLFVVSTVAPDTTGTVGGISVSMIGDTTLEARGLMVTEMDNETIWVELQTSRAMLSKLNAGTMSATVDVSRITEAGDYDPASWSRRPAIPPARSSCSARARIRSM